MSDTEAPRRLRAADVIDAQQEALMAALTGRDAVPWVTVEITDAAKGEVRVETKVSVPLGVDLGDLEAHAQDVVRVAVNAHEANTCRKPPEPDTKSSVDKQAQAAAAIARNRGAS